MTSVVIPTNIEFIPWTSTLVIDLPNLNIPIARTEDDWKSWARHLIDINQLAGIPSPNYFDNWREWANYFVNNV